MPTPVAADRVELLQAKDAEKAESLAKKLNQIVNLRTSEGKSIKCVNDNLIFASKKQPKN